MPAAIGAALIGELALGATAELVVGYAVVTVGTVALQYGAQALLGSDKRADPPWRLRCPSSTAITPSS